jgi:hypothetical protein
MPGAGFVLVEGVIPRLSGGAGRQPRNNGALLRFIIAGLVPRAPRKTGDALVLPEGVIHP